MKAVTLLIYSCTPGPRRLLVVYGFQDEWMNGASLVTKARASAFFSAILT